jgi:hypothetical protein
MATKPLARKGKAPAAAKAAEADTAVSAVLTSTAMATAKLTVSIKRRLSNGDEIFLAPGIEMHCDVADLDATQAEVTDRANAWMDSLLEAYPDVMLEDADGEEEEADAEEEEEAEEDADAEDELTEEDVQAMKLADLKQTIIDYGLEVEPKGMKLADLRTAVIDELFAEEGDADAEEEEEEGEEAEDDDGEEEEGYTAEELKALKLEDLQGIVDAWEIDHPTIKKGTPAAGKKAAYIKYIIAAQAEE